MKEPLVGRDSELRALSALLASEARIVTLRGPIGVGKSSLAREVTRELQSVVTVDLHAESAPEALDDLEQDTELVVLDGADGVLGALRSRVGAWLDRAPGLTLLVTAREALGLPGEGVLEVAPLPVPVAELSGPAAELFLAHARRARPGYSPSTAEAAVVVELLRELDGLPLAIELTAPRLAVMGPAALLHRTRQNRAPGALERAMAGAFAALEPAQQAALVDLSVFAGGFSLEAAEGVLEGPALERVAQLRQKSWVLARELSQGEVRLSLSGSVRDFARHQSAPERLARARARHAEWFAAWAQGANAPAAERENLQAVLESVLESGPVTARQAEPALRVLIALAAGTRQGPDRRYLAVLEPVLERTRDSGADPGLLAHALWMSGSARRRAGDDARALGDLGRALQVARSISAAGVESRVLAELAELLAARGEHAAASEHAQAALSAATRASDRRFEVLALITLARVEPGRAEALLERAAALSTALGDAGALVEIDLARAESCLDDEAHGRAETWIEAARQHASTPRDRAACALMSLRIEHDRGATPPSRYAALAQAAREQGLGGIEGLALGLGGLTAAEQGQLGEAHALVSAALALSELPERAFFGALARWLDARVLPGADASEALPAPTGKWWSRAAARLLRAPKAPPLPPNALVVGPDGRWFQAPGARPVSLERRKPLAKIVSCLARARLAGDEAGLSWSDLQAAGWPGERVLPEAGAHRVRVAISTLRKLGLAPHLLTRGTGYLFDAGLPLVLASE